MDDMNYDLGYEHGFEAGESEGYGRALREIEGNERKLLDEIDALKGLIAANYRSMRKEIEKELKEAQEPVREPDIQ